MQRSVRTRLVSAPTATAAGIGRAAPREVCSRRPTIEDLATSPAGSSPGPGSNDSHRMNTSSAATVPEGLRGLKSAWRGGQVPELAGKTFDALIHADIGTGFDAVVATGSSGSASPLREESR